MNEMVVKVLLSSYCISYTTLMGIVLQDVNISHSAPPFHHVNAAMPLVPDHPDDSKERRVSSFQKRTEHLP